MNAIKYDFINKEELDKVLPKLREFKGELPWVLFDYIDPVIYLHNYATDDAITGFYERKHDLQLVENPLEYLEYDLMEWVKENPEYKQILQE